jgi:hypothetical protein
MVVPIQAGVSVIELQDGYTTARALPALASAVGLMAIVDFAAILGRQHRLRLTG